MGNREEQLKMVDGFLLKADSIPILLERVQALLSRDHLSQEVLQFGLRYRSGVVEALKGQTGIGTAGEAGRGIIPCSYMCRQMGA